MNECTTSHCTKAILHTTILWVSSVFVKYIHTFKLRETTDSCYINFNINVCSFSYSNCTGRGREWPCCVPNYLRTFPKIATETSLLVRDCTRLSVFCLLVCLLCLLFCPSHSLSSAHVLFLSSSCQLYSLFLYQLSLCVNLPPLVLTLPLQMMPRGSFLKAQMTTSMQITSMWVCSSSFPSTSLRKCDYLTDLSPEEFPREPKIRWFSFIFNN